MSNHAKTHISIKTWLTRWNANGGLADVPCGSCSLCCRANYQVEIYPDEDSSQYELADDLSVNGLPYLKRNPDGSEYCLVDGKCSIYERRPRGCRQYDCRTMAITGIISGKDGEINDVGRKSLEMAEKTIAIKTMEDKMILGAIRLAALQEIKNGKTIAEDIGTLAILNSHKYSEQSYKLLRGKDNDR